MKKVLSAFYSTASSSVAIEKKNNIKRFQTTTYTGTLHLQDHLQDQSNKNESVKKQILSSASI